jgi:hypothetical protein
MDIINYLQDIPKSECHTSCISIITPETSVSDLRSFIYKEKATARNIKSNSNRKSVLEGLAKIAAYLDSIKNIPSNGIAMYAGSLI